MRKYFEVAKLSFKVQIAYRFDVAMTAISTAFRIVFALILWGAVYRTESTVAGLSYQAMLSYYVIISLLKSLDLSTGVIDEVSDRVRGGTFSKFMIIPDAPLGHFLAQTLGAAGYYAVFSALAAMLCTLLFHIDVSLTNNLASIACALAMALMGLVFMICYQFTIGILAFKFQDVSFFRHMQSMVLDFATGAVVPLALLPGGLRTALGVLPFPYVLSEPAMLIAGQLAPGEGMKGLLMLGGWTAAMIAIAQWTYNRLRVRYDGVGI